MADRCDVPGCEQDARLFAPTRRRCLAHADGQAPSLRSDVPAPVSRDPVRPCADCGTLGQWGPFTCCDECWSKAYPGTAAAAARAPAPLPIGEPERRVWRQRVRVLLHREIDARHAAAIEAARAEACHDALDAVMLRHAEAERCLETWGALSTDAALRALRGEETT